jgi:hypothetical protein
MKVFDRDEGVYVEPNVWMHHGGLSREADELARLLDEAVPQERVDRLAIHIFEQPRLRGDLP